MYSVPLLIQPISGLLVLLNQPIHPTWLPIPLLPILHAARISIAYRSLNKQAGANTSGMANLTGFLMMAWGGSIASHILLSLPIPQLLSFSPLLVYTATHLVLPDIHRLPSMKTLDSSLPLMDALLRTTSIAAGVEACRNHPVPEIAQSLSAQLFIGAITSSGGGICAQTLRVWEPSWSLSRPSFLQEGTMLASTDVWSGALVAAIYGLLTASHPAYSRLIGLLYSSTPIESPIFSSVDTKAIAASILTIIYFWRAHRVHHAKLGKTPRASIDESKSKKD